MSKVTLEDIHECLIGNKLAGQKGLIDTIDDLVVNAERHSKCQDKMNDKVCIMQNQLSTLMADREKNKNKISFSIPKWVTAAVGIFVKTKTGL